MPQNRPLRFFRLLRRHFVRIMDSYADILLLARSSDLGPLALKQTPLPETDSA